MAMHNIALLTVNPISSDASSLFLPTKKTSSLTSPIFRLDGHTGEIFSVKFSPSGRFLATASMDRTILLWNVGGDFKNWGVLKGHQNAVLDVKWTLNEQNLVSVSADLNLFLWDIETTCRVRKFTGHTAAVSHVHVCNNTLIFTGSDDGKVLVWDTRSKRPVDQLCSELPICALAVTTGGDLAYIASVNNTICAWDMRLKRSIFALEGHHDIVNGLALSPDDFRLLSTSVDGSSRVWDVKAFSSIPHRCLVALDGLLPGPSSITHVQPRWSNCGTLAASGSLGDSTVVVWDVQQSTIKYKLPGHQGGVSSVDFHPLESILASGGLDSSVFIGEIAE